MLRPCLTIGAAVLMATPALAQSTSKKKYEPEPSTFSSRKDHKDGSASLTFGTRLPAAVDTKLGVDLGLAGQGDPRPDPGKLLDTPDDRGNGSGWASMVVPHGPLGFTKATVDARLDPVQDQSKFGMAVSHPVGEDFLMTLQNSYALTRTGIPLGPSSAEHRVETGRILRLEMLSTSTAVSAGTRSSSIDDKQLHMFSAEQKIVGPLSVTGSVSETPTGIVDKTLKAGFRTTW
jgi:hypothetical protein